MKKKLTAAEKKANRVKATARQRELAAIAKQRKKEEIGIEKRRHEMFLRVMRTLSTVSRTHLWRLID